MTLQMQHTVEYHVPLVRDHQSGISVLLQCVAVPYINTATHCNRVGYQRYHLPLGSCLPEWDTYIGAGCYSVLQCLKLHIATHCSRVGYGVATISRLLKMIGLFCKRAL